MKTTKILLSGFLFIFFSTSVLAQDNSSSESTFGIKGGLNYSTVSKGNFDEGPDPRTSFHIGFVGEVPLVPKVFSLQPEMLYSRQGFENTVQPIVGSSYKVTYKVDYLNLPILAKLHLGKVFSIEAGPQFGFKVSEKVETDNNDAIPEDDVNNFDTAIAGGVSCNFNGTFINARFTQSLNEVVKDSGSKNMVFQIGIGFKM
ncbi:MAG: porin family protein [Bacteroidota bacterium]